MITPYTSVATCSAASRGRPLVTSSSVEGCSTPSTNAEVSHDKITPPTTMRGTMILPGQTAADSAGMQSYRGIAWWAYRDDHWVCANILPALLPTRIGSVDRMP